MTAPVYLHVGGLFAMGFDPTGEYLLTISHSGRGVFGTTSWQRVSRDYEDVYLEGGCVMGIGPLENVSIPVVEKDYTTEVLNINSPDGTLFLEYDSGCITVTKRVM